MEKLVFGETYVVRPVALLQMHICTRAATSHSRICEHLTFGILAHTTAGW
jgi:hypothetical protein